jgi:hypothetical protein
MERQSPDRQSNRSRFLEIARDPRIIPGLHRACDEWCEYCPLTDRCLWFRCAREFQRRHRPLSPGPASPATFGTAAGLDFARQFAIVDANPEGRASVPLRAAPHGSSEDDDRLAAVALEYARRSRELASSARATVGRPAHHEPPAAETILRFHSLIYFKTTRALVGYRLAAAGMVDRHADAKTCAGQTLACIDRSRAALLQFPDAAERDALAALLDAIAMGLEARFPDVSALVRHIASTRKGARRAIA